MIPFLKLIPTLFPLIILIGLGISQAASSQDHTVLSATGLYEDIKLHTIALNVSEYAIQYPLYTDGLQKRRWIYLPAGAKVNTVNPNWWDFPEGTKIWKEFSFNFNGKFKRIETRLIQKTGGVWKFSTYLWDHTDSEAVISNGQLLRNYADLGEGVFHNIPGQANCKTCHFAKDGSAPILGFSAIQLDHKSDGLNLETLKKKQLLTHHLPANVSIKASTPEGARAMGLMHGNCGHCHNPNGAMSFINMNLRHDVLAKSEADENVYKTTVNQTSGFKYPDPEVSSKRILSGKPEESVLFRRIKASSHLDFDYNFKMPPGVMGTMTQNKELLKYTKSWINSLSSQKNPVGY